MRTAFINTLVDLAIKDKRIFLLTGDLGFSVLEGFKNSFPKRFFNIGVAEANTIGVAAGLALTGKIVYVYSIVPFITLRCLEQIRNDLCYQRLNVRIIGVGGGLSYGTAGGTHYSLEDIAVMRAMPNLAVICPGDPLEIRKTIEASVNYQGPMYIRLGKGRDPHVHKSINKFKIGKSILLRSGRIAIISTGNMLANALLAADMLKQQGINALVVSMHSINPIDKKTITELAATKKAIFTIEEHGVIGGLGSAVAEILAEQSSKVYFKRIAVANPVNWLGSQDYLRKKLGLDAQGITRTILNSIKK